MTKGRGGHGHGGHGGGGHNRKKEARRNRAERKAAAPAGQPSPAIARPGSSAAVVPAQTAGLAATRGAVSSAYRAWASDYGRRQAQGVAAQFGGPDGETLTPDMFVLAPLTSRTVTTSDGTVISTQMGLPIAPTRSGSVALTPDRLAVTVLRIPEPDRGGALAMLGLGQAPELPQPEALFGVQLPAESMRGVRSADALAWYLARAVEAGDVEAEPGVIEQAAAEALALLRPGTVSRGTRPLDPALLESYQYGADTDEEAVPPDITAAPARGGLAGLPNGAFLTDNGAPLTPLLADLRDYVAGLWPYGYFDLEALTAPAAGIPTVGERDPAAKARIAAGDVNDAIGPARTFMLARLAELTRRLDEVLDGSAEAEEAELAAEGRPPAWIAQETARYREARQRLRSTRVAQELLPLLGPILFELEIPPADYVPETGDPGADPDIIDNP